MVASAVKFIKVDFDSPVKESILSVEVLKESRPNFTGRLPSGNLLSFPTHFINKNLSVSGLLS